MSNRDWAFGLQPIEMVGGGAPTTRRFPLRQCEQGTKYTTKIHKGQIVLWEGTHGWALANATITPGAGGTSRIVGVAAEAYRGSSISKNATNLAVWEGSKHIFNIQSDGGTTSTSMASYLMKNCEVFAPTAGSTITGLSSMELSFSSRDATVADHCLKVVGFSGDVAEAKTGANMKLAVRFTDGALYEQAATIT